MCLFLFAISFAHFRSELPDRGWSSELIIHHAGIPLALFVLLQDYRFVMLDAFVRFLANVFLAAAVTFVVIRTGLKLLLVETHSVPTPLYEALWLTALCLVLIGFALLRGRLQQWLTGAVFRRPSIDRALLQIRTRPAPGEAEPQYLVWAASVMADFMSTERFELVSDPKVAWAEAFLPLRFSQGDQRYVVLGRRRGGRRYLSEDLSYLARLANAVTEQVERHRATELQRLVSQAELRALQSQINPHFLFNALNTLYGTIPREIAGARQTVLNLAEIFRYFLQPDKTFIPLAEELKIIQAYLDIERLRLGPRLITQFEVRLRSSGNVLDFRSSRSNRSSKNAIKHGVSAKSDPGTLSLRIRRDPSQVLISISVTGPGLSSGPLPRWLRFQARSRQRLAPTGTLLRTTPRPHHLLQPGWHHCRVLRPSRRQCKISRTRYACRLLTISSSPLLIVNNHRWLLKALILRTWSTFTMALRCTR